MPELTPEQIDAATREAAEKIIDATEIELLKLGVPFLILAKDGGGLHVVEVDSFSSEGLIGLYRRAKTKLDVYAALDVFHRPAENKDEKETPCQE